MELTADSVDLENMPRADVPALWEDFRTRLERLKATAETLVVTSVDQVAEMKLARETRLTLKNLRCEIDNKRKELTDEALRRKQKVDGEARALRVMIEPLEDRLALQENFAEREATRLRNEQQASRMKSLRPYWHGGLMGIDFTTYTEKDFADLLATAKGMHEKREEEEAEYQRQQKEAAEAERLRQEEQAKENERLRNEAKKREAEAKKRDAELAKATAARKKAEAELAAKKAEEKRAADAEKRAQHKLATASDRKKLLHFAEVIRLLKVPEIENKGVLDRINIQRTKFSVWVAELAEEL